jgi:hypothetical protein
VSFNHYALNNTFTKTDGTGAFEFDYTPGGYTFGTSSPTPKEGSHWAYSGTYGNGVWGSTGNPATAGVSLDFYVLYKINNTGPAPVILYATDYSGWPDIGWTGWGFGDDGSFGFSANHIGNPRYADWDSGGTGGTSGSRIAASTFTANTWYRISILGDCVYGHKETVKIYNSSDTLLYTLQASSGSNGMSAYWTGAGTALLTGSYSGLDHNGIYIDDLYVGVYADGFYTRGGGPATITATATLTNAATLTAAPISTVAGTATLTNTATLTTSPVQGVATLTNTATLTVTPVVSAVYFEAHCEGTPGTTPGEGFTYVSGSGAAIVYDSSVKTFGTTSLHATDTTNALTYLKVTSTWASNAPSASRGYYHVPASGFGTNSRVTFAAVPCYAAIYIGGLWVESDGTWGSAYWLHDTTGEPILDATGTGTFPRGESVRVEAMMASGKVEYRLFWGAQLHGPASNPTATLTAFEFGAAFGTKYQPIGPVIDFVANDLQFGHGEVYLDEYAIQNASAGWVGAAGTTAVLTNTATLTANRSSDVIAGAVALANGATLSAAGSITFLGISAPLTNVSSLRANWAGQVVAATVALTNTAYLRASRTSLSSILLGADGLYGIGNLYVPLPDAAYSVTASMATLQGFGTPGIALHLPVPADRSVPHWLSIEFTNQSGGGEWAHRWFTYLSADEGGQLNGDYARGLVIEPASAPGTVTTIYYTWNPATKPDGKWETTSWTGTPFIRDYGPNEATQHWGMPLFFSPEIRAAGNFAALKAMQQNALSHLPYHVNKSLADRGVVINCTGGSGDLRDSMLYRQFLDPLANLVDGSIPNGKCVHPLVSAQVNHILVDGVTMLHEIGHAWDEWGLRDSGWPYGHDPSTGHNTATWETFTYWPNGQPASRDWGTPSGYGLDMWDESGTLTGQYSWARPVPWIQNEIPFIDLFATVPHVDYYTNSIAEWVAQQLMLLWGKDVPGNTIGQSNPDAFALALIDAGLYSPLNTLYDYATLTVGAVVIVTPTVTLSSTATATATGFATKFATVALTSTAALVATATVTAVSTATFTNTAGLSATATITRTDTATLTNSASLTATGVVSKFATATSALTSTVTISVSAETSTIIPITCDIITNTVINLSADQVRVVGSQEQVDISVQTSMVADYYGSSDLNTTIDIVAGAERTGEYDIDTALEASVIIDAAATITRHIDSDLSISSTISDVEPERIGLATSETTADVQLFIAGPFMTRTINSDTTISFRVLVRSSRGTIDIGQPYGWGIRVKHLI